MHDISKAIGSLVEDLLQIDLEMENTSFLETAHDELRLQDKKRIIEMDSRKPKSVGGPTHAVYEDIIGIIAEDIAEKNNWKLLGMLTEHYSKKFPCAKLQIEKCGNETGPFESLLKKEGVHQDELKCIYLNLCGILYGSDNLKEHVCSRETQILDETNRIMSNSIRYRNCTQVLETLWGIENLKENKIYQRFLSRERASLEKYLGAVPGRLEKAVVEFAIITSGAKRMEIDSHKYLRFHMLIENLLKFYEKHKISSRCLLENEELEYSDMVRWNFENLCGSMVYCKHLLYKQEGRSLALDMIMRDVHIENHEAFLAELTSAFYFELQTLALKKLQEEYCRIFSFDKVKWDSREKEMSAEIASLKKEAARYQEKIKRQEDMRFEDKKKLYREAGKDCHRYEAEIAGLKKRLDAKDAKIKELKMQAETREEFIGLLSNEGSEPAGEETGLPLLQSKKYLFVGRIKETLPELYKRFPNSIFMESDNFSLKGIKVDGIVMLVKFMSHSMFCKVKSEKSLNSLPVAKCNTRNINSVYNDMRRCLLADKAS